MQLELRQESLDGPVLGIVDVPAGNVDELKVVDLNLQNVIPGRKDLVVRFKTNDVKKANIILDWIRFNRNEKVITSR